MMMRFIDSSTGERIEVTSISPATITYRRIGIRVTNHSEGAAIFLARVRDRVFNMEVDHAIG